jgi:arginine-tRNA-protein transferase
VSVSPVAEIVVLDQQEPCPYLADRTARMPLRWPVGGLSREQLDEQLTQGDRRTGYYLYRPRCPACQACESLRVDVDQFTPTRRQRRIARRGERVFNVSIGTPKVDAERVRLFNEHREQRGMATRERRIDQDSYTAFLTESCCDTLEMTYRVGDRLAAVAIVDRGQVSLSAVYCFFDLSFSRYSPGVFSVLTQLRFCREWGVKYLYLGYYIRESPHMAYKSDYLPHERQIAGRWQRFRKVNG